MVRRPVTSAAHLAAVSHLILSQPPSSSSYPPPPGKKNQRGKLSMTRHTRLRARLWMTEPELGFCIWRPCLTPTSTALKEPSLLGRCVLRASRLTSEKRKGFFCVSLPVRFMADKGRWGLSFVYWIIRLRKEVGLDAPGNRRHVQWAIKP